MSVSEQTDQPEATPTRDNAIAIIGLAGRFPGARSIAQFWANVRDGVESIRVLSTEELLAAGVSQSDLSNPDYVRACPVLEDVDKFDARFFGFSPRDASVMDPAHRFFLEVVWEAVEHAGYTALPEEGAVGVFAGSGAALYMMENLRTNPELMRSMGEFLVRHTGNDMNFLATRVSYEMDLRGPSINVQTACSSALVALHMACQSLLSGECTLAIAGGSTVLIPNAQGYHYKEGEILSPDGHCRPFDAKSAGTVFGSGSGCVVLKRLQDALDDGDTIHAVVKGSAINNDGALKVGYLAPGVDGQAAVIERALSVADVPADSISYIETHGTGTSVGDPIEVEALNKAFQAHTKRRKFCAIGSVKSNIGHLGEAAAAASLIKAIMALKHRQLPPSLGYDAPNPAIDFETSPFFVNDRLRPWLSDGPLRCGITALGAGGTNCHVILEEAPERIAGEGARARQLLLLSAKTRSALDAASERLAQAIESDPSLDLADAAFTLALGRRAMPHRRAVAVADRADAIACLRERDPKRVVSLNVEAREPAVVFMFPGGGAQYARMGMDLYESEDAYRDSVDACLELIEPELGRDLRSLMFASEADAAAATRTLEQPSLTLPSLFTAEYALAKQFESWGLSATAFVGHSMGEYVAACLSGVVTLRDALRLVMLRGRLFEQVESGAMLSVPLSEAALHKLMPRELSIAAVNAPELSVASGPIAAIERLQATLAARDIECTRIRIDVAAHSSMLDPILEQFRKLCRTIQFQAPQIPFVSNLSGSWITPAQATDPEYWVKHLRSTVRFADCIESVLASGERVLLEVGPGRTLSMLARAQAKPARHAFNSMRHPQESASDLEYALTSLGRVWSAGCGVDWDAFYAGQLRNRVPLPSYPFEQQSFWVEPGRAPRGDTRSGELGKRSDLSQWFYGLTWAQVPLLESVQPSAGPQRWLIVAHDRPEGEELGRLLERTGDEVIGLVTPGEQLARHNTTSKEWWLDFRAPEQLTELVRELDDKGYRFDHVVYLTGSRRRLPKLGRLKQLAQQQALTADFYGLTYLARALGSLAEPMRLSIVTTDLADVAGQHIDPLRSVVLGPTYVTPREFPQLQTRCIDMPSGIAVALQRPKLMQSLLQELRADSDERLIALRGSGRWVRRVLPQPLPKLPETTGRAWLRPAGVYLVTGGLGGIGLEVAAHLARQERVTLLLNARQGLPPESQWDSILAKSDPASRRAQRIAKVRELRALGADVRIVAADVTDLESMRAALARVRAEVGPLTGVFHAAGLMDDEPMQSKTQASMQRVLAPKLQGSMNLDELIHEPLDFFVLFSSVASFLGLPGQVDYTAANAFLDAFAQERSRRARGRTLVINWNAWREVGMAEAARAGQTAGAEPTTPCAHPALDGYSDEPTGRVFVTDFSLARHWLLSEHRIKGSYALLPGTAFVELARAAFGSGGNGFGVELTNLTFLSPFQVAEGETRRMSIYLVPAGGGQEISMHSGMDPHSAPHVVGEVRAFAGPTPGTLDLSALRLRCNVREECPKDRLLAQDFVAFGARWANIVRVMYGHSEALLELELAPQFAEDLSAYGLHPALLDMATGGAQQLIPGVDLNSDFYVPMRYERIRIVAPMPRRVFSHVRCLAESGAGLAYFDVILCDERGRVFAEITRFTMKRLDAKSAMTAAAQNLGPRPDQRRNEAMDVLLREAISPAEGVDALDRIMAQPALVQSVASSVDVLDWQAQLAAVAKPVTTGDAEEAPSGFSRPNLATEFEAPSSATEHALAAIWSELVGVQQIGVLDDFFDLGGNSLVAVRLFAAIKKHFRVALPLSTLFEAPTIRQLAALLEASGAIASEATAVAQSAGAVSPQAEATDAMVHAFEPSFSSSGGYTPLVPIQIGSGVPFFCVHGAGGNVLNFRDLAKRLTASQSFYGLQAKGVTGGEPAGSIEEMASTYIAAIRGLRPRGPFLLGGYSGGGVVAYEMAQRLRAAGERVNLVLLDTFHPATGARAPSRNERFEYLVAEGTPYFSRTGKAKLVRMLQGFASDARIRYHQRLGAPLPLELREMHITRAFDQAASRYVTKRYDGPVTLYKARNVNRFFEHVGPTLGWAEFIPELEVVHVPGDHTNLMIEPNVQTLINHLKQLLAAAAREEPAQDTATPRLENTEVAAQ